MSTSGTTKKGKKKGVSGAPSDGGEAKLGGGGAQQSGNVQPALKKKK